jgi:hypothetical protein
MLAKLPNKIFTCSGYMMSSKLGSLGGGIKEKVVFFGYAEGSSGLASCPTITDASIFCSIVLPVLFSSESALALWVELAPIFRYRSAEFISGTFLPPKILEGTLVERSDLDLMYLPFGSLGLFMKVNKNKNRKKDYHWVWGNLL